MNIFQQNTPDSTYNQPPKRCPKLQDTLKIIQTGLPMPIDTQLRWLKTDDLSQVSKRFAEFCKQDIKQYESNDAFDADVYQDAIKLVIKKLEKTRQSGHQE